MSRSGYQQVDQQPFRIGTVRNNNPLNPFSSNTTNPQQWGEENIPGNLLPAKDFCEMAAFSLFFSGIYWASIFVFCLIKGYLEAWNTALTFFLLAASLLAGAGVCFRRCDKWYEYGAMEYWQPLKDLFRAGVKRKGLPSLGSGLGLVFLAIVYGPFIVGVIAWVDELGQRAHRD